MTTMLTSNRATITDVKAVRTILDRYHHPLTIDVVADGETGAGTIKIHGKDTWAYALSVDDVQAQSTFKNEELWRKAIRKLYDKRGEKYFRRLLLELAPLLAAGITVQLCSFKGSALDIAKEWVVGPRSTRVRSRQIVGMSDE